MDTRPKAIGYLRVSTEEQAQQGCSLATQRAKIEAWCIANDYELVAVYADKGISGTKSNRQQFEIAVTHTCKVRGALVVYSLSRASRSTRDTLELATRLDKAGADLCSLSEKIDTSTAAGKMVFRMLAVLAEFERDQIAERTRTALAHKRSKGERTGAVPYGMMLSANGITLAPNPAEQKIITLILRLREDSGLSLRAIQTELERLDIRNRADKSRWHLAALANIVNQRKAA
jgi:site-specific DNA recombinase